MSLPENKIIFKCHSAGVHQRLLSLISRKHSRSKTAPPLVMTQVIL